MRVTEKLITDSVVSNLFANTQQLYKTQQLVATGKRINKPSDDPIGMGRVLDCRKTISSIDQYNKNIARAKSQLRLTDSVLASVDNLLIRAKEVASFQSSGTANQNTRAIAAEEVKNIRDQILQLANTKLGNSYIFAGHKTDTPPFPEEGNPDYEYKGDAGEIKIIVGEKVDVTINANGGEAFADVVNIFGVLKDLEDGLRNNDTTKISEQMERLSNALDQILRTRARAGGKLNLLETTENYLANFKLNTEQILIETEDTDITKAIMDLTTLETAYQTSLAAAAKIIQPSLLNFLK